jgi:YggT family protein
MQILIMVVDIGVRILSLIVIVHVFLSYFMPPDHPVRAMIDRIVEPMINPIRRILPTSGMFDFSPIVLLVLVQVVGQVLISLLKSLAN